jgi:hypothetical protein
MVMSNLAGGPERPKQKVGSRTSTKGRLKAFHGSSDEMRIGIGRMGYRCHPKLGRYASMVCRDARDYGELP